MVEWELSRILAKALGAREEARVGVFREAISALTHVPPGCGKRILYPGWLAPAVGAPPRASQNASMEDAIRAEFAAFAARRSAPPQRKIEGRRSLGRRRDPRRELREIPGRRPTCWPPSSRTGPSPPRYVGALEETDFTEEPLRRVFLALRELVEAQETVTPQALLARVEDETAHARIASFTMREAPLERVQELVERIVRRLVERRLLNRPHTLPGNWKDLGREMNRKPSWPS